MMHPLRVLRTFVAGFGPFLREAKGFPRRMRYTVQTRGTGALLSDIGSELGRRLRNGSLAAPAAGDPAVPQAAEVPRAIRDGGSAQHLELVLADEPRASIVIPAFNEFARTHACLASIMERTGAMPYEVIVVDDGSSDETRNLEQLVSGVRVIRNETNLGFIQACNAGASAARGEYVVFLNNDTFVSTGWLTHLLRPFDESDGGDVGLVGAKLVYPDGRLQEAGGIVFSDGSAWNYGRGDDPGNPKYEFSRDTPYCSGACIALPRALLTELGGFDARYEPMYYEDVDLAFQVRAAGRRVVYQPACVIIHFEGGTAGTDTGSGAKRYQVINRTLFHDRWADELATYAAPGSDPDLARSGPSGPRVLIIDHYTPRPDHDAGSERMVSFCEVLRGLGCSVTFVPDNRAHDGDYTRSMQASGVEMLYHPHLPSIEDHLQERGRHYGTVIMSRLEVASRSLAAVRQHCPQARLVFDTVDLHFLRAERRAVVTGSRGDRAERLKEEELAAARACDVTLVVSPAEEKVLGEIAPDLSVKVVALMLKSNPTDTPFGQRSGLIFIGSFLHPPNCDAVEHYLETIHPLVRARVPDIHLTVIGQRPPASLRRRADDTVTFVGHVPDIRPLFAEARLSIAPIRFGAGLKGKIQTSLGFGVPVVTTTVGAEGMTLVDGEHILVADEPDAFADAVVQLHEDRDLWSKLSTNGPSGVTGQCSLEHAREVIADLVASKNGVQR